MGDEQRDDDLQKALASTPWSAILIPFVIALMVVVIFLVITLRG